MILRRPVFIPPPSQTRLFDQHKEFWGNPADNIKDRWKLTDKIPFSLYGPPVDYTYLRTSTPICLHIYQICTHTTTSAYISLPTYPYVHTCRCTHTRTYSYTYPHIYIFMHILIYTHIHTRIHPYERTYPFLYLNQIKGQLKNIYNIPKPLGE